MAHHVNSMEGLRKKYPTATLIRNWQELKAFATESKTHFLEIEEYSGWIKVKDRSKKKLGKSYSRNIPYDDHYLSTHTFYGKGTYIQSTKVLQLCGFNVIIDNWDAEEESGSKADARD